MGKKARGYAPHDPGRPILFSEEFRRRAAPPVPGAGAGRQRGDDPESDVEDYVLLTALTAARAIRPEVYHAISRAPLFRDYWSLYRDLAVEGGFPFVFPVDVLSGGCGVRVSFATDSGASHNVASSIDGPAADVPETGLSGYADPRQREVIAVEAQAYAEPPRRFTGGSDDAATREELVKRLVRLPGPHNVESVAGESPISTLSKCLVDGVKAPKDCHIFVVGDSSVKFKSGSPNAFIWELGDSLGVEDQTGGRKPRLIAVADGRVDQIANEVDEIFRVYGDDVDDKLILIGWQFNDFTTARGDEWVLDPPNQDWWDRLDNLLKLWRAYRLGCVCGSRAGA